MVWKLCVAFSVVLKALPVHMAGVDFVLLIQVMILREEEQYADCFVLSTCTSLNCDRDIYKSLLTRV